MDIIAESTADRQAPPPLAPLYAPKFGLVRIAPQRHGLYMPDPHGKKPAIAVDVVDNFGEPLDRVAWFHDRPDRWWSRRRSAVVLGEAEVERAIFLDMPLRLFPTPHDWLFNHGPGGYWPACCVLDWFAPSDVCIALAGVRIETTPAIARRLRDLRTGPRLDIRITDTRRAA